MWSLCSDNTVRVMPQGMSRAALSDQKDNAEATISLYYVYECVGLHCQNRKMMHCTTYMNLRLLYQSTTPLYLK
jgi:hypothetical protein